MSERRAGRWFVLTGLTRLSVRVARLLVEDGAGVALVTSDPDDPLRTLLPEEVRVVLDPGDHERALSDAGLSGATALLVMGEDDLENLHLAVVGNTVGPDVPIVIRIFNPVLSDQFHEYMNVRRAYSVSALSAPTFVAAALSEDVVATMHLGDAEVILCRILVNPGSAIAGRTAGDVERDLDVAVVATAGAAGWQGASPDDRIEEGQEILVGGLLVPVLDLAVRDNRRLEAGRRRARRRRLPRPMRRSRGRPTLLPVAAAILSALLVAAGITFALAEDLAFVDAVYFTITAAFGDYLLGEATWWLKVVGILTILGGGALAAVLFSQLTAFATAERLEERIGRRARQLTDHVVVAGLGTVGYRVARLMSDLGIPVVAVERSPDASFREALGERAPVLFGDIRLPETLERAGIAQAACLIACTDDDLANVVACLHARRLNDGIRTIARVFDEGLAGRVERAFRIDASLSTTQVAAPAFASAASDQRAVRRVRRDGTTFLALRHELGEPLGLDDVEQWRVRGLRVLAFRRGLGAVQSVSRLSEGLVPGDAVIVTGPDEVVREIVLSSGSG